MYSKVPKCSLKCPPERCSGNCNECRKTAKQPLGVEDQSDIIVRVVSLVSRAL